ncbi:MAG TPA: LysM peptidoglycan-binding domain-containing protein [Blastocatellia bacterium]|nr:LysM peptidoglycan-binding domain-containing protein [Blastocatellia bacterium]
MGIFDKMFGRGASEDEKSRKRFEELRQKYQPALDLADQQGLQFHNLHVENDKLVIRATAPSQEAANKVWDQLKQINPNLDDITADINVSQTQAQRATATPGQPVAAQGQNVQAQAGQTYTVKRGDTLSKISKQFYGDANEYMRIFYANRDKLQDPDKIQVGQQLVIPPETGS